MSAYDINGPLTAEQWNGLFGPPPPRPLAAEDLERILTADASDPFVKGQLLGLRGHRALTDDEQHLVDQLLAIPEVTPPASYTNPTVLGALSSAQDDYEAGRELARQRQGAVPYDPYGGMTVVGETGAATAPARSAPRDEPQGLTSADVAWLDRLPRDPAAVSDEDAAALAALDARITAGGSDRRLLDAVWRPVKEFHDRKSERAELSAKVDAGRRATRTPAVEHLGRQVLAARHYAELVDLADYEPARRTEALRRADERLGQLWAETDAERRRVGEEARLRLCELRDLGVA